MFRKKIIQMLGMVLTAAMLVTGCSVAKSQGKKEDSKSYITDVINNYDGVGASVALIEDGKISEVRNYGHSDKENGQKVENQTRFRIASISKSVTAYTVMQLVDKHVLDLDVPVNQYLTSFKLKDKKYDANKITLRMLLSHTAGVAGKMEPIYQGEKPDVATALKQLNVHLLFEPGSKFSYSEVIGMGICQLVVEEVTNTKYEEYVEKNVFEKLGMYHTDFSDTNDTSENKKGKIATPYAGTNKPVAIERSVLTGGGGVTTTSSDLARFAIELMKYKNTTDSEMFVEQKNTQADGNSYCLGIIPRKLKDGRVIYEHNGTLTGWNAQMVLDPTSQKGMVMTTNSDTSFYMVYEMMEKWSENELGERVADASIRSLKETFRTMSLIMGIITLLVIVAVSFVLYRNKMVIRPHGNRIVISLILVGILSAGIYFVLYSPVLTKALWGMNDFYLFTFFPKGYQSILVEIYCILLAVFTRYCLLKKAEKKEEKQ